MGAMFGADAIQAFLLALNIIAVVLYLSAHHKAKRLYYTAIGDGYGFPLTSASKHFAEGSDLLL